MTPPYSVHTTPRYERVIGKLLKRHKELRVLQDRLREILESDPQNLTHHHPIKKLEAVRRGAGQYRIRLGRFRFRYDIFDREVWLFYCSLRREDTYR